MRNITMCYIDIQINMPVIAQQRVHNCFTPLENSGKVNNLIMCHLQHFDKVTTVIF